MSDKNEMIISGVPLEERTGTPEATPIQNESENLIPAAPNRQKFTNIRSDQRVVTIERNSEVTTQADKQMKHFLELLASLRSRHILTGKLEGVEVSESGEPRAFYTIDHGRSANFFAITGIMESMNNWLFFRGCFH